MAHLFVVDITYEAPISVVDQVIEAQHKWLDEGYATGHLLASGRKVPRKGTVLLAREQSAAELEQYLATSPFVSSGVVEYGVTEFVPTMTAKALAAFRSAD